MLTAQNVAEVATVIGRGTTRAIPLTSGTSNAEWQSMFDRNPGASPFQHAAYVQTEIDDLPPSGLKPVLLQSGSGDDSQGLGVLIPKRVRTGKVGGLGPGWNLSGLRLSGESFLTVDDSVASQSALLSVATKHCTSVGADFLLIEDLDEQSPLFQAVQDVATHGCRLFIARNSQPRWRIDLPAKEEDYWKTFSPRTRRTFRNNLKRMGQTHLERITDASQVPGFLIDAHEISKQSWQSRQFGLRIRNDQSELQRLTVLAQLGFLRSYVLKVADKPAAFAFCHQRNGYFRYEEVAYCAEFSPYSPGVTALQQIVEDLYRDALPRCFDFGGGDAEYKRQFGNRESRSQSIWLVPPTWRAGASLAWLNGCRNLRSLGRHAVKSSGLATKARQWLRYGGRADHAKPSTLVPGTAPTAAPTTEENESHPSETSGR